MTLYDQARENWDKLAAKGFPGLRDCSKLFNTPTQMGQALGFSPGAVHHYMNGTTGATKPKERMAQMYLNSMTKPQPQTALALDKEAPQAPASGVMMVIPPQGKDAAVRRVLAALGCEVVDV